MKALESSFPSFWGSRARMGFTLLVENQIGVWLTSFVKAMDFLAGLSRGFSDLQQQLCLEGPVAVVDAVTADIFVSLPQSSDSALSLYCAVGGPLASPKKESFGPNSLCWATHPKPSPLKLLISFSPNKTKIPKELRKRERGVTVRSKIPSNPIPIRTWIESEERGRLSDSSNPPYAINPNPNTVIGSKKQPQIHNPILHKRSE